MRIINIFMITLLAPFIGMIAGVYHAMGSGGSLSVPLEKLDPAMQAVREETVSLQSSVGFIRETAEQQQKLYREQDRILAELAEKSGSQQKLSDEAYEKIILDRLGQPIYQHNSRRVDVKVFPLQGIGYRGYIAKIKLHDPTAFKVVLGRDELGAGETTSAAVKRTGALLGINGGGFYNVTQAGKTYVLPMGNTIVDGKIIGEFQPSHKDLFFAGVDGDGELLGGIFFDEKSLLKHKPVAGVTFVPALIKNRKPLPIPEQWRHQKQPRTIIGEYGNDDLILIVVDGRQADWSSGVTLEDLQIKLIEFGVVEAYNLDGGGSSSFVYRDKILNRPSDGRERSVPTNIVVMP